MSQHEKDQRDREERLQNQVNNLRSQLKGQEHDRRERALRLEHIKHEEDRRWQLGAEGSVRIGLGPRLRKGLEARVGTKDTIHGNWSKGNGMSAGTIDGDG